MVMTNYAAQAISWAIGSDLSNNFIQAVSIGSGSGTALITNVVLVNEASKAVITGSPDFTAARKVQFTADFNAVTMS